MKVSLIAIIVLSLATVAGAEVANVGAGRVEMLQGFAHKPARGRDTHVGTIARGDETLTIHYDIGRMAGRSMGDERKNDCVWYREQLIGGRKVCAGLVKDGAGRELIVTVNSSENEKVATNEPANFMAKVVTDQDIADVLLTVVTYTGKR